MRSSRSATANAWSTWSGPKVKRLWRWFEVEKSSLLDDTDDGFKLMVFQWLYDEGGGWMQ